MRFIRAVKRSGLVGDRRGFIAFMLLLLMIALIVPLLLMQPSPPPTGKVKAEMPKKLPPFYQKIRGNMFISGADIRSRNLYMKVVTKNTSAFFGDLSASKLVILSSTLNSIRVLKGYIYVLAQAIVSTDIRSLEVNVEIFINRTMAVVSTTVFLLQIEAKVELLGGSQHGWNYSGVFNITAICHNDDWEISNLESAIFDVNTILELIGMSYEELEDTLDDMYDTPENSTIFYMVIGPNSAVEIWTDYMEIEGDPSAVMNVTDGVIEYEGVTERRVDVVATGSGVNMTVASVSAGGWMEVRMHSHSRVVIEGDPIVLFVNRSIPLDMWAGSGSWIKRGHFRINGTVNVIFLNTSGRMEVASSDGRVRIGLREIQMRFLNMSAVLSLRRLHEVGLSGELDIRDVAESVHVDIPMISRFLNVSGEINARLYEVLARDLSVHDGGTGSPVVSNLTINENSTVLAVDFAGGAISVSHLRMRVMVHNPEDIDTRFNLSFEMGDGTEVRIIDARIESRGLEVTYLTLDVYDANVAVNGENLTVSALPNSFLNLSAIGGLFSMTAGEILIRGCMRTEGKNFEIENEIMDVWNGKVRGQNVLMRLVDGSIKINGSTLIIDVAANGSGYSLVLGRGGLEMKGGGDSGKGYMSSRCVMVNGTIRSSGEYLMSGQFALNDMTFITDGAVLVSGSFIQPSSLEVRGEFWVGGRSYMRGDLVFNGTIAVRGCSIINASTYYVKGIVEMRNASVGFHGTFNIDVGTVVSASGDIWMMTPIGGVKLFLDRRIMIILDISVLWMVICFLWALVRLIHIYLRGELRFSNEVRESLTRSPRGLGKAMSYIKLLYEAMRRKPAVVAAPLMLIPLIVLVIMCVGSVVPVHEHYDLYLLEARVLALIALLGLLIDLFADIKVHRKFIDWLTVK